MKKNLKHLLALCLTIALVFSLAACGQKADETPNDAQDDQQTEQEEFTPANYSIAALKGPTAMGLVKLMKDSESGETTGNEYTFTIERTPEYYKMSVKGVFFYGGDTTYEHTKYHLPSEKSGYTYTWHFNQTTEELQGITPPSDTLYYNGVSLETWPANGEYPDYFFTGMPHINYYEGSMTYSSLKLYYPKNA